MLQELIFFLECDGPRFIVYTYKNWYFSLQSTLQVLNISGNAMDSIRDIENLRNLYQLNVSDNLLNDMKELAHVIGGMFKLWRLDVFGNPLCHKAKYRDRVIVMAKNLGEISHDQD